MKCNRCHGCRILLIDGAVEYCSDECRNEPVDEICSRCGYVFKTMRYLVRDDNFCSQECQIIYQNYQSN